MLQSTVYSLLYFTQPFACVLSFCILSSSERLGAVERSRQKYKAAPLTVEFVPFFYRKFYSTFESLPLSISELHMNIRCLNRRCFINSQVAITEQDSLLCVCRIFFCSTASSSLVQSICINSLCLHSVC